MIQWGAWFRVPTTSYRDKREQAGPPHHVTYCRAPNFNLQLPTRDNRRDLRFEIEAILKLDLPAYRTMVPNTTKSPQVVAKIGHRNHSFRRQQVVDIMDPTEPWCPEIVGIMAKYGQTPEDLIVSDESDDEDELGIKMNSVNSFRDMIGKHSLYHKNSKSTFTFAQNQDSRPLNRHKSLLQLEQQYTHSVKAERILPFQWCDLYTASHHRWGHFIAPRSREGLLLTQWVTHNMYFLTRSPKYQIDWFMSSGYSLKFKTILGMRHSGRWVRGFDKTAYIVFDWQNITSKGRQ